MEGPNLIKETSEKVPQIQARLRTTFSKQSNYANQKRKEVQFNTSDHVFLKVSPMKGVMRFGKKGKLTPRYIGSFKILEGSGKVSYRLDLPPNLSQVHPVFYKSMLQKYVLDPTHVLPIQEVTMEGDLSYKLVSTAIIDR